MTAATSRERSCLWMAGSRKSRRRGASRNARETRRRGRRGQTTRRQGEGCQRQPGCSFTNVHHVSSLLETRTGPEVQRRGQRAGSWRKLPSVRSSYSRKAYIKVEPPSRRSASASRHVG